VSDVVEDAAGKINYYEFPYCMHAMAAALHLLNVDPAEMRISLPFDEWWKLWCALERKYRGLMRFDGRGRPADEFQYMGVTFCVEKKK
jgi:hypothetical protein